MWHIRSLSREIAQEFRPEKIILFGSYARGNPGVDSDIDLFVVMRMTGRLSKVAAQMRLRLDPTIPIDIVVRTSKAVRERLKMGDGFVREIIEKGKVLYEADHPSMG